jgi:RNA polymerase sigma factor (TIGR02999 family)
MSGVTSTLKDGSKHDTQAAQNLLAQVYDELRKLAAAWMEREFRTQTLQPTALVHEAWLRLMGSEQHTWENRAHFFSAAAESMRRILIDCARRKQALKRAAVVAPIEFDRLDSAKEAEAGLLLLVNEAIERLAQCDQRAAEVVKLRFFVGLSHEEAAGILGISERTAKRHWTFARAWLYRELSRRILN